MTNYAIFYSFKKSKDILEVCFSDASITSRKEENNVVINYHDDEIVSYEIKGIDKLLKIHADGLIPLPFDALIDVINGLLVKAKLEPLPYKKHSDYYVAEVLDIKDDIVVKTCDGIYNLPNDYAVNIGEHVILAKKGTFINDKTCVKEHHICSYRDLNFNDSDELIIADELALDNDLFEMEK